ncbi:MAG: HD domain-containing protein, partial [Zoogloeaceae bacterium]|nr:HD domain-containing protein [Zoogloeaceae bacterium]
MNIVFYGVRGSLPATSPDTAFYGGNTACVGVFSQAGERIFLDAGTGLAHAGRDLPQAGVCHILITHGHSDHTNGFWFFRPLHHPGWTAHLYLPEALLDLPDWQNLIGLCPMPFSFADLAAQIVVHPVRADEAFTLADSPVRVTPFATAHEGTALGYRLIVDAATLVYTGDHEFDRQKASDNPPERAWLADADLAIVDATFSRAEWQGGWGHSAWEDWLDLALEAGTRQLILSHHLPARSDAELDCIARSAAKQVKGETLRVEVAREGAVFLPTGPQSPSAVLRSDWLTRFLSQMAQMDDQSVLLDALLSLARQITLAEAGTIFLIEDEELVCGCAHNDALFSGDAARQFCYQSMRLPISDASIAGHAVKSRQVIQVPDVFDLPPDAGFAFDDRFDQKSGYSTRSVLVVPFFDDQGEPLGAIQLLNRRDPARRGSYLPFSEAEVANVRRLAVEAAAAVERSNRQRQAIFNLLRMVAQHDPMETRAHAVRVGTLAAEIYQCWAQQRRIEPEVLRHEKGRIRLAAMLHDVGKVAIRDDILQKPGKLTEAEFTEMRAHTRLGEELLADDPSNLAELAREVARHHHQKWNGKGYADSGPEGALAGADIPLAARITCIADV